MKYEILAMLTQGQGAIVNISSIYGFKPSDIGGAPYSASKFALIGLSKSAAIDYAQQGIRVNVVSPGFTHSEMVDPYVEAAPDLMKAVVSRHSAMNRLGEAAEVAEAIAWLCSDAARFVNGAVLPVDGGDTTRLY
jgi:NAD(P)-dependent dehydrogenase (short-subunit alcohol dehydrogenase family)